jgi:hypothetical protein
MPVAEHPAEHGDVSAGGRSRMYRCNIVVFTASSADHDA